MKKIVSLLMTQALLLHGTATQAQDHTVEVFPRALLLPDGSLKINLKNDTNRPLFCEFLKAQVTLRDKEQDMEFDDYIETKNVYLRPGASGSWLGDASIIDQYKIDFPAIKIAKVSLVQPRCFFGATSPVDLGKNYMKKWFDPRGFYFYAQEQVSNQSNTIDMWNAFRGTKIKTLNINAELLTIDAYGHLILSDLGTKGTNNIIIYDPETQKEIARINDLVDKGTLSADMKYLLGKTSAEWTVRKVWDLANGQVVSSSTEAANCYQVGEYAKQCASALNDGRTVQIFSLPDLKLVGTLTSEVGGDIKVTSSFDGRYLALTVASTSYLYEKVGAEFVRRGELLNEELEISGPDVQVIFSANDYRVFIHTGRTLRIVNINRVDASLVNVKSARYSQTDYRSIAVSKDNSGLLFMDALFGGVDFVREYAAMNWNPTHVAVKQPYAYSPWTNMIIGNNGPGTTDFLYPLDN